MSDGLIQLVLEPIPYKYYETRRVNDPDNLEPIPQNYYRTEQ